ncbi:GLPGLI family protein [Parafilimonas sp.]|uniref:GLPGLI family protein n=1 Tax=Parafilimonas sp. TaxID=1969739 RepID=UPI0039E6A78F
MKYIFTVCSLLLVLIHINAQTNNDSIGYVEYSFNEGAANVRTERLCFTKNSMVLTYVEPSAGKWPLFANKKYNSLEDSLADVKTIQALDRNQERDRQSIYRNVKDVFYIRTSPINGKRYCFYDTVPNRNWELTPDTQTIAGFACLKANFTFRSGVKGYAWYAPELAVPFGPETWYGLPGLILEVGSYDNFYKISVLKITIPYEEKTNLQPCINSKLVSKNEFSKIQQENNEQGLQQLLQKIQKQKNGNNQ